MQVLQFLNNKNKMIDFQPIACYVRLKNKTLVSIQLFPWNNKFRIIHTQKQDCGCCLTIMKVYLNHPHPSLE